MIKEPKRNITDCLVITAGFVIIGIITDGTIYLYLATIVALVAALIPQFAFYISFLWQGIGKILGFFVSKIVLAIVFYCFLLPFSILHKLFSHKKSISNKNSNSYWIKKEKGEFSFTKLW